MSTYTEALRELAKFIDTHTDIIGDEYFTGVATITTNSRSLGIHVHVVAEDEQKQLIRKLTRALGGTWTKNVETSTLYLVQSDVFGFFEATIFATRDAVCERRTVGTKTVTIPAVEAAPERVEEVDEYEWDCKPIFADEVPA